MGVKLVMRHGFEHMQASVKEGGGSVYLRLSTRQIQQPFRTLQTDKVLQEHILKGAYWHVQPTKTTKQVVIFSGVVAPDMLATDWKKFAGSSHASKLLAS